MVGIKLTKPCENCPFRPSVEFPLGTERRREIARSLLNDWSTFPCHKTTHESGWDEEGQYHGSSSDQHCVGALIVLEKEGRPNVLMRIARTSGDYHPDRLQDKNEVYDSLEEFIEDDPEEGW